jgi:hypothetical protein
MLADLHNSGTEVAGTVSRSYQALKQRPMAVVGIRRIFAEVKDLVGFAVGMGRQVAAEGRC